MKNREVIWSPIAEETYLRTLEFILNNHIFKQTESFEQTVNKLLSQLQKHRKLCPKSISHPLMRRCVISSQTSLFYRITNTYIDLVAFIDNRSNVKP